MKNFLIGTIMFVLSATANAEPAIFSGKIVEEHTNVTLVDVSNNKLCVVIKAEDTVSIICGTKLEVYIILKELLKLAE